MQSYNIEEISYKYKQDKTMINQGLLRISLAFIALAVLVGCGYHKGGNSEWKKGYRQNWKKQYSGEYNKYARKYNKYNEDDNQYVYKYNYKYKYNKYDQKQVNQKPVPVPQKPKKTVDSPKKTVKPQNFKKPQKIILKSKDFVADEKKQMNEGIKQENVQQPQPILVQTIQIQQIQQIKRKDVEQIVEQTATEKQQQAKEIDCLEKPVYDYNLLVLTWVPAECYTDKDCEKDWQTYDDLRSPTIHGYRPFSSSSYYENCFGHQGDPNCQKNAYMMDFQIDEALWNVTGLLYDISQYWPAHKFTHDDQNFYTQQWIVHGSCYLMNMIEDNEKAYKTDKAGFNRTIMVEYFKTAIAKFKKLEIDVDPGKEYNSKQEFAEDIGFKNKETHFVMTCDKNNEIMQIIFCYNRSKLPSKQVTIPCTLGESCDESKPFRLKKPL